MDLVLAALKQLNVLIASLLVVYAWGVFKGIRLRILFLGMMLAFTISTVLFFPEGEIDEWLKHAPFYAGQLLYLLFMLQLSMLTSNKNKAKNALSRSTMSAVFIGDIGVLKPQILTERGIQHILAAPIFVMVAVVMLVRMMMIHSSALRVVIFYFLIAGGSLSMIHVFEYIVETRELLPILHGEGIELIELIWFYLACGLFAFGLKKYRALV